MSWKTQVQIDNKWVSTSVRLATQAEAERLRGPYEKRLPHPVWSRAVECTDPVNCTFAEGTDHPLWIPETRVPMTEEEQDAKYLASALKQDPQGGTCGWCGGVNTWADDCGFHYMCGDPDDPKDSRVTCESCFKGTVGTIHVFRYGLGER